MKERRIFAVAALLVRLRSRFRHVCERNAHPYRHPILKIDPFVFLSKMLLCEQRRKKKRNSQMTIIAVAAQPEKAAHTHTHLRKRVLPQTGTSSSNEQRVFFFPFSVTAFRTVHLTCFFFFFFPLFSIPIVNAPIKNKIRLTTSRATTKQASQSWELCVL